MKPWNRVYLFAFNRGYLPTPENCLLCTASGWALFTEALLFLISLALEVAVIVYMRSAPVAALWLGRAAVVMLVAVFIATVWLWVATILEKNV